MMILEATTLLASSGKHPAPIDGATATLIAAGISAVVTILAALVGAAVLLRGYRRQQEIAREQDRDRIHAEAIEAVYEYLENPYRIRRRDGTNTTRVAISDHISDVQVRLRYFDTLIRLNSTREVADSYSNLVATARREAGVEMGAAWTTPPTKDDRQVSLGSAYSTSDTDAAMDVTLAAMAQSRVRSSSKVSLIREMRSHY